MSTPNAVVFYQDEVHFFAESTITRGWYRTGSEPKVKSYAGHKSIAYSGFVSPKDGRLITLKVEWFTYETVIESLRSFIEIVKKELGLKKAQRIYLVMDNAPWHKKAKRLIQGDDKLEEYADIREVLTIVSLPAYSPDLNPIEQVWRITRREKTHNRFWRTINLLTEVLDGWFASFRKPNAKLTSLCSFSM